MRLRHRLLVVLGWLLKGLGIVSCGLALFGYAWSDNPPGTPVWSEPLGQTLLGFLGFFLIFHWSGWIIEHAEHLHWEAEARDELPPTQR